MYENLQENIIERENVSKLEDKGSELSQCTSC